MSTMHTCLACGVADWDVAMRLVEVATTEQRVVAVAFTVLEDSHGRPLEMRQDEVRERYIAEPRCRDTKGCAERVAALAPKPGAIVEAERAGNHDQDWLR